MYLNGSRPDCPGHICTSMIAGLCPGQISKKKDSAKFIIVLCFSNSNGANGKVEDCVRRLLEFGKSCSGEHVFNFPAALVALFLFHSHLLSLLLPPRPNNLGRLNFHNRIMQVE